MHLIIAGCTGSDAFTELSTPIDIVGCADNASVHFVSLRGVQPFMLPHCTDAEVNVHSLTCRHHGEASTATC